MGFLPNNSGGSGPGTTIGVVANYAALPSAASVSGAFRWVQESTGIHLTGLYYSNGTSWEFSPADDITVVANYSALPAVATVSGQFYWCSASQGTAWLPGSLGGTYYSAGLYYSNGVAWSFLDVPYQATQSEVHAGTNTDKFVTPATLAGEKDATGGIVGLTLLKINFKNAANTFTNFLTNATTASRTWTFQDKDYTVAGLSDIPLCTYRGGSNAVSSPFDLTTVYTGLSMALAPGSTDNTRQFKGVTGTLKDCLIYTDATAALGSNEACTLNLWNVTDGTSAGTIGTFTFDVRGVTYRYSGLSIPMLDTKYYSYQLVYPAFGTNPTNVYIVIESRVF